MTLACAPDAVSENAARVDAVMLRGVDGGGLVAMLGDARVRAVQDNINRFVASLPEL